MRYAIGLMMLLVLTLAGCWAKDTACAVIKTAADVCTVLEYVGEDGKTYRVKVPRDRLERLALEASQKEGLPSPRSMRGAAPAGAASASASASAGSK